MYVYICILILVLLQPMYGTTSTSQSAGQNRKKCNRTTRARHAHSVTNGTPCGPTIGPVDLRRSYTSLLMQNTLFQSTSGLIVGTRASGPLGACEQRSSGGPSTELIRQCLLSARPADIFSRYLEPRGTVQSRRTVAETRKAEAPLASSLTVDADTVS